MTVSILDPLTDTRWDDLLERHPSASIFHSRGWLQALKQTYGYEPAVVTTTTAQAPLENGLAFCRVRTWGSRRLVSLPFSDHCEPLVDRPDDLSAMLAFLQGEAGAGHWRSIEVRPRKTALTSLPQGTTYHIHMLDLARPTAQIFEGFHPSSTQRAIRRAEREHLGYESGNSERLLSAFYGLLRLTRRRHGLPPQPVAWFHNLVTCLGNGLTIHLATKDGHPIATIMTVTFKKSMVYKYGGSDTGYHRFGSMPFLFWQAIQEARTRGIEEFDLGRSDLDQPGLVTFKDHLGATRATLTYYTHPAPRRTVVHGGALTRAAKSVVAHLPDSALDLAGTLLYKHLG